MKTGKTSPRFDCRVLSRVGLTTVVILLIPFTAMQLTAEVRWDLQDFVAMGLLVFAVTSVFLVTARRFSRPGRLLTGIVLGFAFLCIWAELSVGLVTKLVS